MALPGLAIDADGLDQDGTVMDVTGPYDSGQTRMYVGRAMSSGRTSRSVQQK